MVSCNGPANCRSSCMRGILAHSVCCALAANGVRQETRAIVHLRCGMTSSSVARAQLGQDHTQFAKLELQKNPPIGTADRWGSSNREEGCLRTRKPLRPFLRSHCQL